MARAPRGRRGCLLEIAGALVPLLLYGCGSSERSPDLGPPRGPQEQMTHSEVAVDRPFVSHRVTHFRTEEVLPGVEVRALALLGGELWAATASGAAKLNPEGTAFAGVTLELPGGAVDLAQLGDGRVVVAGMDGVVIDPEGTRTVWPTPGLRLTSVAVHQDAVLVGSDGGVARLGAGGVAPLSPLRGTAVRDLAVSGDLLYAATGGGVRRIDLSRDVELPAWRAPAELPDDDVRALAVGADGATIHAGTATGRARHPPQVPPELEVAGLGGLATGEVTALAERGGTLLVGHEVGVGVVEGATRRYLHSPRWLAAERVTGLAVAEDGTRYVGTTGGVSRHAPVAWTLAEKAEHLEPQVDLYWRMDGFLANEGHRADRWSEEGPLTVGDNDNDGLWTQMQIAAWCFAYATTRDRAYYEKARRAMDTMFLLQDVPGATFQAQGKPPGFIARSLVRSDEGPTFEGKRDLPNWHLQEYGGKTYRWKADTSQDEYTGHFFGMPVFHDLCAQSDEERGEIRRRLDLAMGNLVDHGYRLLDLDGEPTTHGDWSTAANAVDGLGACIANRLTRCAESYGGEGWLNSIQILGFLVATWHVTGKERYRKEYLRLADDLRYAEMVAPRESTLTVTSPRMANHSDHELATLAYFTLLRYEPEPARRRAYLDALRAFYEHERPERNALLLGLMAGAVEDLDAEVAAQTLRELPHDRRLWEIDNSHRRDATLRREQGRFGEAQFDRVFPYDELGELEWNSNLYAAVQGLDGRVVQGLWPYLLPYWSLRYFRALE